MGNKPLFPNLQCSGVVVVPMKTARRLVHNNYALISSIIMAVALIMEDEFMLNYSRIDNAICLIKLAGGQGAHLVNVDLKSAFTT